MPTSEPVAYTVCDQIEVVYASLDGMEVWSKPAVSINSFYGTAVGQISYHVSPDWAVYSGSNLTSIENYGGDAGSIQTFPRGNFTLNDGLLHNNSESSLRISPRLNVMSHHVMFVMQFNSAISGQEAFGGPGNQSRWQAFFDDRGDGLWRFRIQERSLAGGPPMANYFTNNFPANFGSRHLFEFVYTSGTFRMYRNGTEIYSNSVQVPVELPISRICAGVGNGQDSAVGDVIAVVTSDDGSHSNTVEAARSFLIQKYSIT